MADNSINDAGTVRKPKHVYRVGDRIRIVRSRFIKRVGYALHPHDLRDDPVVTEKLNGALFVLDMHAWPKGSRAVQKVLDAVCFAEVSKRGFGGNERMLHYLETRPYGQLGTNDTCPDWTGYETIIEGKRIVQTGKHFGSSGGRDDWSGEYYYEPGGLDDRKTHVLLDTHLGEIASYDVEPA